MKRSYFLLADDQCWRLCVTADGQTTVQDLAIPSGADAELVAQRVKEVLAGEGYADDGIALGIPSHWCLCTQIATDGLSSRQRRGGMIYRLEEMLPIAAEEIVCDFIDADGHAFGVCVEIACLEPFVTEIERSGVEIHHVCPIGLMALQHAMDCDALAHLDVLIWATEQMLEVFVLRSKKPAAWYSVPTVEDLAPYLRREAILHDEPLRIGIASTMRGQELQSALRASVDAELVAVPEEPLEVAAAKTAEGVLQGSTVPLINVRRDALAPKHPLRQLRRPLIAAVSGLVAMVIFASAALIWRGTHYQRMSEELEASQRAVFHRTFPDAAPPAGIQMRLASEARRLRGISGLSSDLPAQPSAFRLMLETFSHLPTNIRYRILDARFDTEKVLLEGQARSHAEADVIASSLRQSSELAVEPPRTEQLAAPGVSFTLDALVRSAAAPTARERD